MFLTNFIVSRLVKAMLVATYLENSQMAFCTDVLSSVSLPGVFVLFSIGAVVVGVMWNLIFLNTLILSLS